MNRQMIKVKDVLKILQNAHPEAPVDFYNYGTNFEDADLSQLEERGGRSAEDMLNVFISQTKQHGES